MMSGVAIEQVIYGGQDVGGYRFLARSGGFKDDWLPRAEQLCAGFGERPAGVRCPECLFAHEFGKAHVAVVQVADQGTDDSGRPGALAFRLLIIPREAYRELMGDPFLVAERFPAPWETREQLPTLSWPAEAPPRRSVAQVQDVLKSSNGPTVLGGAQALVDGGRLVFERSAPDLDLIRGLWMLLPSSTRCELWPATFAFGNALGFDAVVTPHVGDAFGGYVTEEQAEYYPEGRYELNLQIAAEADDQKELDRLFARRSRAQTWRLGLILLAVFLFVVLLNQFTLPTPRPPEPRERASESPAPTLDLPPYSEFPTLSERERAGLTESLREFAQQLGIKLVPESTAEKILASIDAKLGTPDSKRDPGPHLTQGPIQRRLRALLWKHAAPDYADTRLSSGELLERLRQTPAVKDRLVKEKRD